MKLPSDATIVAAKASSSRLRHWLLHGPAQIRHGAHAGGVVGSFDELGYASYIYAEITGYYLLWLKGLGKSASPKAIAESSERSISWVRREFLAEAVPATRTPLHSPNSDWRNQAVFFFDIAMVLRGVIAHAKHHSVTDMTANLAEKLARFVRNENIEAAQPCVKDALLPSRWSTKSGPFLLKATAAIDLTSDLPPQPGSLRSACIRHLDQCLQAANHMALDMLHPTLYFAEGLVRYGAVGERAARRILSGCLRFLRHDGALPESTSAGDAPGVTKYRNDVAAQALRLGLLLRQLDGNTDEDLSLELLAQFLIDKVDGYGRIGFDADNGSTTANTWTAMFTEQALRWYAERDADPQVISPWLLV